MIGKFIAKKKMFLDKLVSNEFPCMIVNKIVSSVKLLSIPVTSGKVINRKNCINFIGKQSSIHQLQTATLEEVLYGCFLISKEFSALFCLPTLSTSAIFLSLQESRLCLVPLLFPFGCARYVTVWLNMS